MYLCNKTQYVRVPICKRSACDKLPDKMGSFGVISGERQTDTKDPASERENAGPTSNRVTCQNKTGFRLLFGVYMHTRIFPVSFTQESGEFSTVRLLLIGLVVSCIKLSDGANLRI